MLTTMENYLFKVQRRIQRWARDPRVQSGAKVAACGGSGFFLSAASLSQSFQPLAMGLVCAMTGWRSVVMALGAMAGYRLFWGEAGLQGVVWAAGGCLLALIFGKGTLAEEMPLLIPALAGVIVAVTGLIFLFFRQGAPMLLLFLRLFLAPVSAWFFRRALTRRDSVTDWICGGIGVLALAEVVIFSWLGLGYTAAGVLAVWASFPGAALAGLGLDLAQVTRVPMAAVICTAWFARMLPFREKWMRYVVPGVACVFVMALCGIWDPKPMPGLILGGLIGYCLPPRPESVRRRGETGVAQVRLELTAGVLAQTQRLLLEVPETPVDDEALFHQAVERSCGSCTSREVCQERARLQLRHLYEPEAFTCRRQEQIRQSLHGAQERLRTLKADRQRRQEYRSALVQQYQFLSVYLRQLSDQLPRRGERIHACYRLEVSARSRGKERANGDCCLAFPGTACRYYVLLCDGMGTGLGAAEEGGSAGELLKKMLTAGFPPEYAFRSVNSILALRGQAGAVTMDLCEVRLDSGRVSLYKWGAAPSWLWNGRGAKKIGTATPPPGISVSDAREMVVRLSLRRGEVLILLSDGVEAGECLRRKDSGPILPPGELAQWLLEECTEGGEDDATVAVLRLHRRQPST